MTGLVRTETANVTVMGTRDLMDKIGGFAVFCSVNGHAQATIAICHSAPETVRRDVVTKPAPRG